MAPTTTLLVLLNILILLIAIAYTQIPYFRTGLLFTKIDPIGNMNCTIIEGPQSCEKIVVHGSSGHVYMACGSIDTRRKWMPYFETFNEPSLNDYVTYYDPTTERLQPVRHDLKDVRGLNVHGMDVVQSSEDPKTLYIYMVNHRPQLRRNEHVAGADSTIELFKTEVGSESMRHIKSFHHPDIILTPNDIAGSPDGKSFFFTNDFPTRTNSWQRALQFWFEPYTSSVGYCHVDKGCKLATTGVRKPNGIVRVNDETYWVAESGQGKINVFTREADNSLIQVDQINIGKPIDNLTLDENGNVWVSVFAKPFDTIKGLKMPGSGVLSPSAAYKVSLNQGHDAYFGKKYLVEKVFEDDGTLAHWVTTAAADSRRRQLYMHGMFTKYLVRCPI